MRRVGRRFAGRMRQEAARLTFLVQDLITLNRIPAAEPIPDPRRWRSTRWSRSTGPVPDEGQRGAGSRSRRRAFAACRCSARRTC